MYRGHICRNSERTNQHRNVLTHSFPTRRSCDLAMRRLEFLSVRVLLSQISPSSIILYKPSGKPYLSDGSYNIGISHSKNYACILLNSTENISVDIEYKSDKPGRLKDRFISPSEISEEEDINLYSTICWSAKETVFKYFDAENVDFKEHIVISPFHFCDGMINIKVNIPGFESEKTVRFNIFEEFVLTYIA